MNKKKIGIPDKSQLKQELRWERKRVRRREMISGTLEALLVAAAVTVLAATVVTPILQIDGSSMEPSLCEGEMVVSVKSKKISRGDVIAFHSNNKVLIKRVVALEGETIHIDEEGRVYIDGEPLAESYLAKGALAFGKCNITLPCEVPEGSVFVMGDNREVSVDSRSTDIGCIAQEQIISKVKARIWPLQSAGFVD